MIRFISFLLFVTAAVAQTTGGRLLGTVSDHSKAVVPGASVSARNVETGIERSSKSNGDGLYAIFPLPPGVYDLSAQAPGFKTEVLRGIRLDVAASLTLNLALVVGAVEQEVTVSADATPTLTQSISVESTIEREQIDTLPLNGRDFNQLVLLAAGAVENINSGNGKDFGSVAVNGNRAFSNDYLLDGSPNNDLYQGRSGAPVSVDVIREFKVTSNVAAAEFGQAGTQISVVTRSGTNRSHGSLFEYIRNNTWEARDPFNTKELPPFRRDQFGGSLGGPVIHDRTFYFFNYEGNRQSETVTRVSTVPLEEMWRGDFSSLLARNIVLRDPFASGRPVIPNNRLDQYQGGALVSKTAVKMHPFWSAPTSAGLANNLLRFADQVTNGDQFTIRGDHALPRNQALALRYTMSDARGFTPSLIGSDSGLNTPTRNHNGNATWTLPISPRTMNEFRFGGSSFNSLTTYLDGGLPTVESLGLKGFEKATNLLPPMPRIVFTGPDAFTPLNYGGNENFGMAALVRISTTYSVSDALTHTRGKHNLKAGFEMRRTTLDALQQTDARGRMTFRGANSTTSTGYSFADFLIGLPASTQEVPGKAQIALKLREFAGYIQDDWRITSRLSITLGLRHELYLSPYEEKNRYAMFDITRGAIVVASDNGQLPTSEYLPSVVGKLTDKDGKWRFPLLSDKDAGFAARRLVDTNWNNWGPRFGIVWQASKMVVRGGYGIFYTRYPSQYLLQTVAVNPPFAGLFTYSQAIVGGQPTLTTDVPFAASGTASVSPAGLQKDFGLPNNQQWNLTVERELGASTVLSLGYVGNKGTHLFRSINANGSYLDKTTGTVKRRYSDTFGTSTINFRQTDGNSIYNAMELEVRRRARKGLMFQGNWTWAKGIDDTGATVQAASLDLENLGRDRANSDYVRRHILKVNASYELPVGRGRTFLRNASRPLDALFGGWRLAGIWQYTTGMYFTPQFASTGGLGNNRPDVVSGVQANLRRSERNATRWFNPAAFAEVPVTDPVSGQPRFGNAGRNILSGPGLNVMDASLAKSFPLWREGHRVTFRLELFNFLNHPNFDFPDGNISNVNTVATINRVVRPMRQAQFAFRYDF